jgi:hypothetical protein
MCVLGLDLIIDKFIGEEIVRYFNSVNIARWNYYLNLILPLVRSGNVTEKHA